MATHTKAEAACDRLARRQHGAISRRQAMELGLPVRVLQRRVAAGRWVRVYPGVYRLAAAPHTWHSMLMAAVLCGGPDVVATGAAAGRLRSMPGCASAGIELLSPRDLRIAGVIARRRRGDPDARPQRIEGIPVATVERMLLDLAAVKNYRIEKAVREALRRRLTDANRLRAFTKAQGGHGVRGIKALRSALELCDGKEHERANEMEDLFASLMRRAHLDPVPQYVIKEQGRFVKRPDFVFVAEMVAIELDGRRWHGDEVFETDREVDVVLGNLGWRVLRFTWRQLTEKPGWVVVQIRRALELASSQTVLWEGKTG